MTSDSKTRCASCGKWTIARQTHYDDGSVIDNYRAPDGLGHCEELGIDTKPDFFCAMFSADYDFSHHIHVTNKAGAPWQYSRAVPCPECTEKGLCSGSACRCAGTGKVRLYDDGFLGEEHTRLHPKEKELLQGPKCVNCGRKIEIEWVACPMCGHKLEHAVKEPEVVSDALSMGFRPIESEQEKTDA